ncbi:MAG: D-tyrosyl-tRNA(Tyr) deacylase [Firmicutes bacterium HGW-Firmicutes-11]|jgi:D-tyrosyl-tRNA(Tyr) deacylase|nr:MAG: D-tyrosyl-tRNA(Tyr) deacylase [Firmicutes bacterium HGW-Firmicutes-11]
MRAVVQRVKSSNVAVDGTITGSIGLGLTVLLGVEEADNSADASYMAEKITGLRIFEDEEGKMNRSVLDVGGEILAISQFTLFGDCRKGKRPSFIRAARPEQADVLYQEFISECKSKGIRVAEGVFRAEMLVNIANDGPVTIMIDSKKEF